MLLYAASQRRSARNRADLIAAIASGYAGCQSRDGARAMERMLDALRG